MSDNPIPVVNNSKKISQLRGRDVITQHQDHSWLAVAQYNDKLGSYHNIAINLSAITAYAIENSYQSADYIVRAEMRNFIKNYNIEELRQFSYVKDYDDYDGMAYAIMNSAIGYNVVSYTNSYTLNTIMWDHYPSHEDTFSTTYYICTESGSHIITENNKNIIL